MRPSDPDALCTKTTTVAPDFEMATPKWDRFLATTYEDSTELIDYQQTLLGVCTIGKILEHVLPVDNGRGRNGKSTKLGVLQALLGMGATGYAMQAEPKLLTSKDAHPTGVAALRGKRIAICSELDSSEPINAPLMKMLTGGDKITARKMRQDFEEFDNSASLMLACNELPKVSDGGHALWSRMRSIPHNHVVTEGEQVKDLKEQLIAEEGGGILAWIIRGAVKYHEAGELVTPDVVLVATHEYRLSENAVARFVEEWCVVGAAHKVRKPELQDACDRWCSDEGIDPLSSTKLTQDLRNNKLVKLKKGATAAKSWYEGIRLKMSYEMPDDDAPD
jgi:putative DNA primase/helicase